jgi:hypothetical protein
VIRAWLPVALLALLTAAAGAGAQQLPLEIETPPSLEPIAARIREIDRDRLIDALDRAGLAAPPHVRITLIPEDHARARATPSWIVAQASGSRDIVIFPARIGSYPHDSLDSVVRHEIVHLALFVRAGGRPLPRWFHEGVAVSVEEGWGLGGQLRLMVAAASDPSLTDLSRLFASDAQPENASAYLLATALVSDVRRRHGAAVPGAIASRVAGGMPFRESFAAETGESPEMAANHAWAAYRRWVNWIPVLTDGSALWLGILVLAMIAFIASLRRRARQRRRWDEEDDQSDFLGDDQDGAEARTNRARMDQQKTDGALGDPRAGAVGRRSGDVPGRITLPGSSR